MEHFLAPSEYFDDLTRHWTELEEREQPPEGTTELTKTLVCLVLGFPPLEVPAMRLFLDQVLLLPVRKNIAESAQGFGTASA